MDLFLDITLGLGLALAAGLRPFVVALLAGALAGAGLGIDFHHHGYSFLQAGWWLVVMAAGLVVVLLAEVRVGPERLAAGPAAAALSGLSMGIGAVLFAGAIAQRTSAAWIGLAAGVLVAGLSGWTAHGLLARTRARLDEHARRALGVYAEAAALALAALTVLAPPLSLAAAVVLLRLALAAHRRGDERYAGLRILR